VDAHWREDLEVGVYSDFGCVRMEYHKRGKKLLETSYAGSM
jgi:hypothetical protein